MSRDLRRPAYWRLLLAGILLGMALGMAGCSSTKADMQRSDVEQMYKDGRIDRITYEDMMQKIADKEAAAHAAGVDAATVDAAPRALPPPAIDTDQPAPPPPGQAPY
jgi:hypothetical protein